MDVTVPRGTLTYGREYGVTKKEAERAFTKGFKESAREKPGKYKGILGFDFRFL